MNPISMVIAVLLAAHVPPEQFSLARTLIGQADVARARGDDSAAITHLRAAVDAARSAGAVAEEAAAAVGIMDLTRSAADLAMAEPLVARALALAPGETAAEAEALRLLAAVSAAAGDRQRPGCADASRSMTRARRCGISIAACGRSPRSRSWARWPSQREKPPRARP